jgi:hypothetical protein
MSRHRNGNAPDAATAPRSAVDTACGYGLRAIIPAATTFFSLDFFLSTFFGVSRQGEFKNTTKICLQKVHVENLSHFPKQSINISMSVFPRFFLFYRVFGCFSAMGVQKH